MLLSQLSLLLLIIFVAGAAIEVWRRGDRRRGLSVGGSITFFALASTVAAILVFWGKIDWPFVASPFYLGIVVAMGHELSRDLLRAAQLARQLHESEQRMSLAAEAAQLGIWVGEFGRDAFWATDRLRAWFGFAPAEPLGFERMLERVHPEDRATVRQTLATALAGDGSFDVEYRVAPPDAPMRWMASRGRVEFDGKGQPLRVRDVAMDITHRKQAEAEARQHRDQVAHLARVATLGELSAALAHELNQPLTAILSNAQAAQRFLAQDPCDLSEIREILQDIVADDQRASEVIHSSSRSS